MGTVHVGHQHARLHGLQKGHHACDAMIELMIAQSLREEEVEVGGLRQRL